MFRIQGLYKKFGNYHALDGLDMELKDGALFGFVGPNGAGKTTTIKIMTGLLKPDQGSVEQDGQDMLADPKSLQKQIGYVPDHFGMYDNLKVSEYMGFLRPAIIWRASQPENGHGVSWNRWVWATGWIPMWTDCRAGCSSASAWRGL